MAPWYPEDILSRKQAKYRGEIHPKRHACMHTLVGLRSWVRHFCAWIFVGWLLCWFCCLKYDSWEVWYVLDLSLLLASYSHCLQEKKQESRLHFRRWISERAREREEKRTEKKERFKLLARKRKKNLDSILDGVYKREREKKKRSRRREKDFNSKREREGERRRRGRGRRNRKI